MGVAVRSFGKINIGLRIGAKRDDGFHELRTVYQTIALHDVVRVEVGRGTGIEIRSKHPLVPCDESNTCYRIVERALRLLKARGKVVIQIEKHLPIQGGLGAASSNAIASLLGLERALRTELPIEDKFRIAGEVGSDLPLFLLGGTVLGLGRGEEVYPLEDLPALNCVVAIPKIGVSTAKAFADWDERFGKLTTDAKSDRLNEFHHSVLAAFYAGNRVNSATGVSGEKIRGRAEALLLDLVRTGIENDFERVVFPQYPELRDIKRALEREGAAYASLSGSGSTVYGLFAVRSQAIRAALQLRHDGISAVETHLTSRKQYPWVRFADKRVAGRQQSSV